MLADYESTYHELAEIHQTLDVHIHQNLIEFAAWTNLLRELRPRRWLEIGMYMLGLAERTVAGVPSIDRLVTVDVKNWRGPEELERRLPRHGVACCTAKAISSLKRCLQQFAG